MKFRLLIILAVFNFLASLSQETHFGIKGGVNFSNITENNLISSPEIKTNIVGGLFASKKLNEKVGVQAELLYSRQGFNYDQKEFKIDYLNVPFVLKYFFLNGLHIQLGPQFGVLLNERRYINGIVYNIDNYDISILGGIGYDLLNGLKVEARYSFGLNNISPSLYVMKNRVISLALGYSFY